MMEYRLSLSNIKNTYERKAYTFFLLLGDTGGFNGSIITVCSVFMSYYAAAMY